MARTRWLALLLVLSILTFTSGQAVYAITEESYIPGDEVFSGEVVYFADENLARAVREALRIGVNDSIYTGGLEKLTELYADGQGITDLTGLERATGLKKLFLNNNQISDLSPLANLSNLKELEILNNLITDLTPLQGCTRLERLYAGHNDISDIRPLTSLDYLYTLKLWHSNISDVSPLLEMTALKTLFIKENPFSDSAAGVFTQLRERGVSIDVEGYAKVPVTGVELEPSSITLKVGEYKKLSYSVLPKNASVQGVTWHSKNESVAKVTTEGKVIPVAPGTTQVKVMTKDGGKIAWCTVTVIAKDAPPEDPKVPVTGVTLNHSSLAMAPGEHFELEAAVVPADADNKKLTWSSNDTAVAKVDGGKVIAVRPGAAVITVTSKDGGFTAACEVTVSAPEPTEAAFNYTNKTLKVGTEKKLQLIVSPEGAWAEWSWQSSNPEIASVDAQGKVTALAPGETIITVSSGTLSAECVLTVVNPEEGEEIQYELDKPKNCLSIPKEVLEDKDQLDIKQGKMQIVIPTNAWLDALAQLELDSSEGVLVEVEEYQPSVSGKLMAVGPAYNFNLTVDEVKVSNFADKLLLTINYDPEAVKKPEKLAIYWFNDAAGTWDKLPSIVDSETHTVSALINHWSSFALLQPAADSANNLLYILLAALGLNAVLIIIWLVKRR